MMRVGRRRLFLICESAVQYEVKKLADYLWELPQTDGMRVPARIYATEKMLPQILADPLRFPVKEGARNNKTGVV
jgi:hypothetical protein